MIDISHLVVNGCSFTYCQGLDNPKEQGWPTLLAKKLNVPVVNLAIPGCGNDTIKRRTYEYFYENASYSNHPLYIMGWTMAWRCEGWHNDYYRYKSFNDYGTVLFPNNDFSTLHERSLLEYWSEEAHLRKTMLCKAELINLFKAHNVPFLFTTMSYPSSAPEHIFDFTYKTIDDAIAKIKNNFAQLYNAVDAEERGVELLCHLTETLPKLPCGHEGLEAQEVMANYIYEILLKRYEGFTINNEDYLTLDKFRKNKDFMSHPHTHWL